MFYESLSEISGVTLDSLCIRLIIAFCISALISILFGKPYIALVRTWQKAGQPIRTNGPKTHLSKLGTPTMGGWIIIIAALSASLLLVQFWNSYISVSFFVLLAFAMIGFFDDYMKIRRQTHVGISARQKLSLQILISIIAIFYLRSSELGNDLFVVSIPFTSYTMNLGYFYIPFATTVIIGSSNAVNLTDGLDGLASGTMMIALISLCYIALSIGGDYNVHTLQIQELAFTIAALAGGCAGFLCFNKHPARIFMGDTGSLALGSFLGVVSIILKQELLLVLIGGVFVIETLSVIIQVAYFRYSGGKRVFLMAPLHHHFEQKGWSEKKVVLYFYCMGFIFAMISIKAFI